MKKIDLLDQRFGRLVVIKETEKRNKDRGILWLCRCDCGNEVEVAGKSLRSGNTKSCGCLQRENTSRANTRHGKRHTRLYSIWTTMRNRCYRENQTEYKNYGDRGISVCDEWRDDFQAFYDWAMDNGYQDDLTIDRIDWNGNYEPSNCRWATQKEQQNNRRNNHLLTHNGETHTMSEWAEIKGIKAATLYRRLKDGWMIEKAIETPVINGGENERHKIR